MLAFLVGGVAVAATSSTLRRALLLGSALVGAAAAIKVIALVALPLLSLLWWRYADPRAPTPRTSGRARAPGAYADGSLLGRSPASWGWSSSSPSAWSRGSAWGGSPRSATVASA